MSELQNFNDSNFELEVLDPRIPVFVDFWAEWCSPCLQLLPVVEELSKQYEGKVKFGKVNIDKNPDVSVEYNIRSIPTIVIFKNGKVEKTFVGVQPKSVYRNLLDSLVV